MVHRGPDADGLWVDTDHGLAFGHRRLSVVGLGPEGAQPMHSPDGRWVLDYNGELYNYRQIRKQLMAGGMGSAAGPTPRCCWARCSVGTRFGTRGLGGHVCAGLVGPAAPELHLVRDRFGEKPLYYGWVGDSLAFASELEDPLPAAGLRPEIDPDAVALYLRHNCVPAPHTIYRGVSKLLPGHLLTVGDRGRPGGPLPSRSYWSAAGRSKRRAVGR